MPLLAVTLRLLTATAHAQLSTGSFGIEERSGTLTVGQIIQNIVDVGLSTIIPLCTAVFIAGAFLYAASAGDEQRKSLGKDLMIGAAFGLAIVAAAGGIMNIVYSFLYAP